MKIAKRLSLIALLLTILPRLSPAGTTEKWETSSQADRHSLTYSSTAGLSGISTPFSVEFQCDPKSTREIHGTLGFDLTIRNTSKLTVFPFDDFEGPDAAAAPVVKATVARSGKAPLTFVTTASGSIPSNNQFCFGVSEPSRKSRSTPKSILQALAAADTESVQITVADPRNPALKLEVQIPVAGRQADFQRLLSGLK